MSRAWLLALALGLSACGGLQSMRPAGLFEADPARAPAGVDSALAYHERIRALSAAEAGKEYEAVRAAWARDKSDGRRLQLAMLLALPNTRFHSDREALELLDPWTADGRRETGGLRGLGAFLAGQIAERRKADEASGGLARRLREEQKKNEALQEKLDALKKIEKSLIQRP